MHPVSPSCTSLIPKCVFDKKGALPLRISGGKVQFSDACFSYDPRKPTLVDVSFTAEAGQTVALVGETGGGNSTILKLLFRFYDATEGSIKIDGQDLRDVTLSSLRDAFGVVPQDPSLFNMSIMENVRYARLEATDDEVKEACENAAIHDKIMTFPDGYMSKVGERGVKLSGGELQRVSIARAMIRRPHIVLLDEATSMIDTDTEAQIQEAFSRLSAGRTTFIIAHRLATIMNADLILVVNDGRIIERGTHQELFALNGKYVSLWSKQTSKKSGSEGTDSPKGPGEEVPLVDLMVNTGITPTSARNDGLDVDQLNRINADETAVDENTFNDNVT
ncbi:hypothetical protein B0A49_03144 [Cryomyces minteri]|uniref:ABC transporter domain-containing protein n=1 Tax=Cryomyces minteri TaxID=331657 RepID=A0A4U0XSR1_9PEZI|nr:hypothetical protein B0A49_03144 [Cryomyces minteri]